MFQKLLVANRGEIAIRAFRAANELGIRTVAVYAHEDRNSLHCQKADEAYQIGEPGRPVRAYLDVREIVRVAKDAGADAIYPGYGFLSENPELASAAAAAGIAFVGPPPAVLAVGYLTLIAVGGLLLMLPPMTHTPITLSDALFTSTSAVTVTGLNVVDTELVYAFWGQLVIAVLIQLGGLGLMTFAVLIWSALGRPLGITQGTYLREDLNQTWAAIAPGEAFVVRAVLPDRVETAQV